MLYTNFKTGKETYKLRLTAAGICELEDKLGKNPLDEMLKNSIPRMRFMLLVIHQAMQPYHHGISFEDVCDIYDEWINDGHAMSDLADVIYDIFQNCGLIKKPDEKPEKKKAVKKEDDSPKA